MMILKITKCFFVIFALLGLFFSKQSLANNSLELKSTEVDFFNQKSNRPVKVKFWYQANSAPCEEKICLLKTQSPDKVAVVSHGAFGSPREMNWLGYALASQGWLVAGVSHYGESWVYGPQTIDPSSVMKFWLRPQDVSFTIDSLSDTGLFNTPLNTNNVLMLGHSSGGFTTLAMAGAKLAAGKTQEYCSSEKAKEDKGCSYGSQKQKQPANKKMINKVGKLQATMQDNRVSAVIALDPALGYAASEESLKDINVPTLVIGSVENDFLPFDSHAQYYANNISGAKLVGIEQGAGHFIYIDQCDANREVNGVPLCKDREGVNRKQMQKQVLNHIFGFIYRNGLI